jgi:hypothetical protein
MMMTVGDLRARDVLPSWQEAVAIVQELVNAAASVTSAAAFIPDIDHIRLNPDGAIEVLPGSSVSSSANPVRRVAVILELLLDGVPAPDQLKALVTRNVTDPPEFQKVEEFAQAVSFFERPGRRSDIQALVERASAASERTRADEELRRLQAKALEASERSVSPNEKRASRPERRVHPVVLIGGLTLVVSLLTAAATWYGLLGTASGTNQSRIKSDGGAGTRDIGPSAQAPLSRGASPASASAEPPTAQPVSLWSRLSDAVRSAASSFGRSTPSAAAPPSPAERPKPTAQRRRSRRPAEAATARAGGASSSAEPILILTELGGYPLEPATPDLVVDTTIGIYSSGDSDVQAPVMVRPVLPTAPPTDVPANQLGTLELLVNERGNVEHVRLVSPFNRHQERMIVANAKTWKFTPATRDGRPVKYHSRVRLTI